MSFLRSLFTRQFFFTLLLVGLLALLAFPLTKSFRQKRSIEREIKGLEEQALALEHKNSNLKSVIEYMQSDQFVEKEARTKLNYQKPGETVVVVEGRPGEMPATTPASPFFDPPPEPTQAAVPQAVVNARKWADYFFKPQDNP